MSKISNNSSKPDRRHHGLVILFLMFCFFVAGVAVVSTLFQSSHKVASSINKAGGEIQQLLKDVKEEVREGAENLKP